jgi:hypothetical protein
LNAQYNLSNNGDEQVVGGLYYRVGDSFIPMIGFIYKNIRLMFTYDVTSSALSKYTGGSSAWEFALTNYGNYSASNPYQRQSLCPNFKQ